MICYNINKLVAFKMNDRRKVFDLFDERGNADLRGFLGDYTVKIATDKGVESRTVSLSKKKK